MTDTNASPEPTAVAVRVADLPHAGSARSRLDRAVLLLAVLAAACCGLALQAAASVPVPVDNDLGLAPLLPMRYWVALIGLCGLFAYALVRHQDRPVLLAALVGCLVLCLYGAAAMATPIPRGEVTWRHIGIINTLTTSHGIDPDIDAYFNWPGFFALFAVLSRATGLPMEHLALWAPVWNVAFWLAALAWLLRAFTRDTRRIALTLWLFTLGNWIDQDYLSPQAFGFFFYVVIIGVVLHYLSPRSRSADSPAQRRSARFAVVVVVILSVALTGSHQLTPFMVLVSLCGLVLARKCTAVHLPVVVGLVIACWLAFPASAYLAGHPLLSSQVNALSANLSQRLDGTPGHLLAVHVRMALTGGMWALAVVGAIRDRRARRLDVRTLVLAGSPFVLVAAQPYGGEMLLRVALFALPLVAYLAAGAFLSPSHWPPVRVVALATTSALLVVASVTARYANARFDTFGPAESTAVGELYHLATPGSLLIAGAHPTPWRYREYTSHRYLVLSELCDAGMTAAGCTERLEGRVRYADKDAWLLLTDSQEASVVMQGLLPRGTFQGVERRLRHQPVARLAWTDGEARIYHLSSTPIRPVRHHHRHHRHYWKELP